MDEVNGVTIWRKLRRLRISTIPLLNCIPKSLCVSRCFSAPRIEFLETKKDNFSASSTPRSCKGGHMNNFIRRLIIFLIRRRLGIGHCQFFQFQDQLDNSWYYFTRHHLMKYTGTETRLSQLSLTYLVYAKAVKSAATECAEETDNYEEADE